MKMKYTFLPLLLCSMQSLYSAETGDFVLIQTQAVSNATSVIFTVTTTYNNYALYATNVPSYAANDTLLIVQLSTDGGNSFINTNYILGGMRGLTAGLSLCYSLPYSDATSDLNPELLNLTSGTGLVSLIGEGSIISPSISLLASGASRSSYIGGSVVANAIQILWDDGLTPVSGTFSLYGIVD